MVDRKSAWFRIAADSDHYTCRIIKTLPSLSEYLTVGMSVADATMPTIDIVPRLVPPEDDGQYPQESFVQFDVQTWQVRSNTAHLGRQVADDIRTEQVRDGR